MPMIDVTATEGTFVDSHALAQALAEAVMRIEQVPDIPMFRQNTAGFVHEIPAGMLADVDGSDAHVRVQVLTTRRRSRPGQAARSGSGTNSARCRGRR